MVKTADFPQLWWCARNELGKERLIYYASEAFFLSRGIMQGVNEVGAFVVEDAAWSTLRWCRKTSIDAGRRVGQIYVVPVFIAVGGELGGSWPGMLLSWLGSGFFASPGVGEENIGEDPL